MAGGIRKRPGKPKPYEARYRDHSGTEHSRSFTRLIDAQRWRTDQLARLQSGTWTDPKTARTTVADWCDTWMAGHHGRPSTLRSTSAALKRIKAEFGSYALAAVRPSQVRAWTVKLKAEGLADGYVLELHKKLSQVFKAAVDDDLLAKSPCSRRTSPRGGEQRAYVATVKQVWGLHAAFPPHMQAAVLLGAFAGLRNGEVCGLRPADVDFGAQMIRPVVQWPAEPLKTEISQTAIPVPGSLLSELLAAMAQWPGAYVLTDGRGGQLSPDMLRRATRRARASVPGLPEEFRFHDLRHVYASLLIASGLDVKTVQARVRHKDATTTLNVYGHLFPDRDDPTRAAIDAVFQAHAGHTRAGDVA